MYDLNEVILDVIKKFDGRMPTSKELRASNSHNIEYLIMKNGGYKKVAEKLSIPTKNKTITTLDGHRARSVYELIFDNFLYLNNIKHNSEEIIFEDSKHMCDFVLYNYDKKYYVEIWGYNSDEYLKKRKIKELKYKENELNLISIEKEIFHQKIEDIVEDFIKILNSYNFNIENIVTYDKIFSGKMYSKEILIDELKIIISKINKFPTFKDLKMLNKTNLDKQICKYGGYRLLRKELNYEQIYNDWSDDKILKNEILPLCKKFNRMPTEKELLDLKRSDILNCYARYGLKNLSKMLGYKTYSENMNIKKSGYWQIEENLKKELNLFIGKIGKIPTNKDFLHNNRKDILNAFIRYYGGLKNLKNYI